ncbi:ATP12 family chaperone protein [Hyphomicrobium sp.]|jgi:chaperone required for assembly of F1-ATPase|uniref:ATP12 family chaperone protein n=1 Tax=Hyphomicrobium sp. TaxID=82 RepID=UPI003565AB7A
MSAEDDDGKRAEPDSSKPKPSGGPAKVPTDSFAKPLPRRFYKEVSVGDGAPFHVLLDGRQIKTPKKRGLALPTRALAEAVADEWRAQADVIDPRRMPLTRFANTAIDAVADTLNAVAADIVAYAGSDLLCYRAEMPKELVELQAEHWDPIVAWANETLGTEFHVVFGIVHSAQPADALAAFSRALLPHDAMRLTGLHIITTLTGSALIALALARDWMSADAAWKAAHVDEDYQVSVWGEDAEAVARRRGRRAEFDAAVHFLTLLGKST